MTWAKAISVFNKFISVSIIGRRIIFQYIGFDRIEHIENKMRIHLCPDGLQLAL